MDSFVYSINATVPVFLVMLLGGVIKKLGIIDDHFANVANRYVFKVALPVLLFRDLSKSDFKSQFEPKFVLYCSIVTILMFSLVWIFTELLMKDDTQKDCVAKDKVPQKATINERMEQQKKEEEEMQQIMDLYREWFQKNEITEEEVQEWKRGVSNRKETME